MLISVIVTVRNEAKNIRNLLDSLIVQGQPLEVIVVDSASEDGTQDIVRSYTKKYDFVKLYGYAATRGESRNYGVKMANGEAIAFIDGDCIANPFWLKEFRKGLKKAQIVAGKTINIGYQAFVELERVELYHKGFDLTYPSCNLCYSKEVFEEIGGFDAEFITAEDIDLNFRAINVGGHLAYNENAIVYHCARSTVVGFFKQAFWNGFGRKQLTLKHGRLWSNYRLTDMFKAKITFWYLARLIVALLGYVACKVSKGS